MSGFPAFKVPHMRIANLSPTQSNLAGHEIRRFSKAVITLKREARQYQSMKRIATYIFISLLALACATYGVDYGILRYRLTRNLSPYANVSVLVYYAIQEKNGRTEYASASTEQQTCVNTLFPHSGVSPCWYVRRHPERVIRI